MSVTLQEEAPSRAASLNDRSVAVYQAAVRKHFSFLKSTSALDDLFAKSIPLADGAGYLLPVCELHTGDAALISLFSQWRSENAFAFPSQFPVTDAGTASWLRSKLLDVEDRLLFLVIDRHGKPAGHLGYANCLNENAEMEIDNVVRGVRGTNPGLMTKAMEALLTWASDVIGPAGIFLRVFHDNEHAIKFYRQLGFTDGIRIPLSRRVDGPAVFYDEITDGAKADQYFLRMNYTPKKTFDGSRMILTAGPTISAREMSYALDAARNGWNTQWSKYIKKFEQSFADYLGMKHAISTSSCTGALHLALLGLGVGPGDEVIVPDITWVATANAIVYAGATPVFVDVQPDSWCMDPKSLAAAVTERTKAIIPVHLYGHPAKMDEIMAVAAKHKLLVLEDGAPAIGAEFEGRKVGTFGNIAAFSFQGAKLAVTGEGGILVTNDSDLYERVYSLWDQGRDLNRMFWINKTGWKYKMSNIQAALGLGQIERVDELIEAKRKIFGWYEEGLAGVRHITLNYEASWARSIYWMTSIVVDENAGITREGLREELKKRNIDTRPVFPAISQYPVWPREQAPQPTAKRIGDQGINLPSGHRLRREEVDYICSNLRSLLGYSVSS
ncbi:MAG: perosamine synthetase [Thermoanaerobaculia bacterium]|jgi:perosamine synthetase|nr:perosamine synthetase [Thermoanaerobaculia bacterium]